MYVFFGDFFGDLNVWIFTFKYNILKNVIKSEQHVKSVIPYSKQKNSLSIVKFGLTARDLVRFFFGSLNDFFIEKTKR